MSQFLTAALTRRAAIATALAGAAQAGVPAGRRLAFEAWRGGKRIGRHTLDFDGDDKNFAVRIEADFAVSLGPISLFRYRMQAVETWRGGRFAELTSRTVANGRQEQATAIRGPDGVLVRSGRGAHKLPPDALPLTHWNEASLRAPLFNPETGAAMREAVARQSGQTLTLPDGRGIVATRYTLAGDASIVDWYDAAGVWRALSAKAADGSRIDYRQSA
jgi:hypothetical protein